MGTTAGVGMAIGPSLSGWLVGSLGWRPTFADFAAVGLIICSGSAFMADSKAAKPPRIDLPGAVTLTGALVLVMFGGNQASDAGWGSARVIAPLVTGLVLLVVFAQVERRSAHPVLDLGLLRNRRFMAWCLACLFAAAGPAGVITFLPTYLQGVSGASAQSAGLLQARIGAADTAARVAAGDLDGPDRALHLVQFTDAWHVVLWCVSAVCVAAAVTVWAMLRLPSQAPAVGVTAPRRGSRRRPRRSAGR